MEVAEVRASLYNIALITAMVYFGRAIVRFVFVRWPAVWPAGTAFFLAN